MPLTHAEHVSLRPSTTRNRTGCRSSWASATRRASRPPYRELKRVLGIDARTSTSTAGPSSGPPRSTRRRSSARHRRPRRARRRTGLGTGAQRDRVHARRLRQLVGLGRRGGRARRLVPGSVRWPTPPRSRRSRTTPGRTWTTPPGSPTSPPRRPRSPSTDATRSWRRPGCCSRSSARSRCKAWTYSSRTWCSIPRFCEALLWKIDRAAARR